MLYLGGAAGWICGSGGEAVQRGAAASPCGEGDELREMLCAGCSFYQPLGPYRSYFPQGCAEHCLFSRLCRLFPVAATTDALVPLIPRGAEKDRDLPVPTHWGEVLSSELCPAPALGASGLGSGQGSGSSSVPPPSQNGG